MFALYCAYVGMHIVRVEGLQLFLFHRVDPRDKTQVVRHGGKCLYLLSYLTGPGNILSFEEGDGVLKWEVH